MEKRSVVVDEKRFKGELQARRRAVRFKEKNRNRNDTVLTDYMK